MPATPPRLTEAMLPNPALLIRFGQLLHDRSRILPIVEHGRAEVADVGPASARIANGDIAHLPVLRQVAEQHEVTLPALEGLSMQARVEHAHVEAGGFLDVRNDDVQVVDLGGVERQQAPRPARRRGWR